MRRVVPLIAALALLGGCSQTMNGSASGSGSTSTEQTSGSAKPTSATKEPAKRPKTINIEGMDPCTLATDAQRAEVGLNLPPKQDPEPGRPGCSMSREDRTYSVGIYLDSTKGIETYTDPPRPNVTTLQVGGFPAVLLESTTALGLACSVIIDVSDGQLVDVQAHSLGETNVPALCRVAQPLAGAVVANLMSK
ncbi:hypothetical protein ALI22I_40280 [Saccharothrix sp. ALI-22-I]|uniref:DUF3558 domain-containing protein n=1 Tax=Saccharothrix sp. ALI-22-I TaxID=1933778 RepID=UPI00097C12E6|nr:DUF3558 domain-containing protein [Saccharothrix sp. ALI-22-I]ONI82347.1 hypothetical protein ALI22I_40280 [Saccharothrix sp. ALI-22-I]